MLRKGVSSNSRLTFVLRQTGISSGINFRNLSLTLNNFFNCHNLLLFRWIFLLLLFTSGVSAQPKTNLDVFYVLVDSSAADLIAHLPASKDSVKLEMNLGERYSIFGNKVMANLFSSGKILSENKSVVNINFVIDNAKVEYGEIFRDGFFGDYYIQRTLSLKGNYLIRYNSSFFEEYNFTFNDSIKFDEISFVENESFSFTKGEIPSEPFFSGLFEPIVAIGTTALAVILFFTIRSK
jgi:hypothetical protein